MISYEEFVKAFDTELVGDRLIGIVDGVRCYVAELGGGKFELTEEGHKLVHGTTEKAEAKPDAEPAAPRRRGRPAAE